jgi:hypothetical protein
MMGSVRSPNSPEAAMSGFTILRLARASRGRHTALLGGNGRRRLLAPREDRHGDQCQSDACRFPHTQVIAPLFARIDGNLLNGSKIRMSGPVGSARETRSEWRRCERWFMCSALQFRVGIKRPHAPRQISNKPIAGHQPERAGPTNARAMPFSLPCPDGTASHPVDI